MRPLLLFTVLVLVVAGCSSGDTNSSKTGDEQTSAVADLGDLTVAVGAAPSIDFAAAALGVEMGVWDKRGLTVTNMFVRGGGEVADAIEAGDARMGLTTGPAAVASIVAGLPAKIVGAASLGWVGFVVVVSSDSDIRSISDLRERTIGFSRPGSTTDYIAERIATSQDWTMGIDVFKVSVGGLADMVAALKDGAIDAFTWTAEPAYALEEEGEARVVGDMGDILGSNVFVSIVATTDLIEGEPDVVRAYLSGWMETVRWMRSNKAEAVSRMSEMWGMSPSAIARAFETSGPNLSTTGLIPERNLAGVAVTVADLNSDVATPPSPADFYDPRFVPVASG